MTTTLIAGLITALCVIDRALSGRIPRAMSSGASPRHWFPGDVVVMDNLGAHEV